QAMARLAGLVLPGYPHIRKTLHWVSTIDEMSSHQLNYPKQVLVKHRSPSFVDSFLPVIDRSE
ncbi:MAG: hypothetical protein ACI9GE_001015, partial [Oceanospirillaceae bacterium]